MAENLRLAQDASPGGGATRFAPLMPQRVGQLVWSGLSQRSLDLLRPFITLLPVRTAVNLNTASAPVVYASIAALDMAQAERLVASRQCHPRSLADVGKVVANVAAHLTEAQHSVGSRFFEVQGRLRDQTVIEERSVVQREGLVVKTLWRDRGTQIQQSARLQ